MTGSKNGCAGRPSPALIRLWRNAWQSCRGGKNRTGCLSLHFHVLRLFGLCFLYRVEVSIRKPMTKSSNLMQTFRRTLPAASRIDFIHRSPYAQKMNTDAPRPGFGRAKTQEHFRIAPPANVHHFPGLHTFRFCVLFFVVFLQGL